MDAVEKIAETVLYEGYLLWPYRRSTTKNQQRWTFGGVYPRAHSEARGGDDPWRMRTQCLVVGNTPRVNVKVRYLHVVERDVAQMNDQGKLEPVDELQVAGERYLTWDEATEREILIDDCALAEMKVPHQVTVEIPAGRQEESLVASDGTVAGAVVRCWHSLEGTITVAAERLHDDLFRLTVEIINTTPWHGQERERTLKQTFVSTHTILTVEEGEFVSLMDPPEQFEEASDACENLHTWPVLAGEEGSRHTMLSSPIILYDYPQIAPESPGDLFDGTEIDQLLLLNILTLTDEEKEEMRATDPRAREILERSESLTADDFMGLHGAIREFRTLRDDRDTDPLFEHLAPLEQPAPESITVDGVEIKQGSSVRLRPRAGGDIMDIALDGKIAIVETIEQDYEGRIHLAVTIAADPGRELGQARMPGHRFFFSPDEIEPIGVDSDQ